MSTFKRYLSVFLIIGCIIFLFGLILIINDKNIFRWQMIIGFALAICIYVFPMSLFLSYQASVVKVKIDRSNAEVKKEIDYISTEKCNRKVKEVQKNRTFYRMENSFNAWLTNPIIVLDDGENIVLEVPRAYKKYFKHLLF